ncbi:Uncharacterised protein [Mycobacteroides abscessus subsp. massiliense]|uniref:helix-turn-helix domain-containing protein n=1 Tax=Mycobacteroides abscessus TaxID=36809 RepID=UPI0009D18E1A|nr:Uncharacterised protein [Mycobacteroides abscessus subsp. massiliense]SKV07952.1 Uncharacterised protein [Mycobacteroides abscessus subsp. massiliense]
MWKFDKYAYLKALHGVDIAPNQFRVLVTMLDYTNQDGERAFPGIEKLSADCCISRATVKRSLAALEGAGWLTKVSRGGRSGDGRNRASEYSISQPSSMAHPCAVEEVGQRLKADTSTAHLDDLNGSNGKSQRLTGEPPSDHLTSRHLTSDHEASARLIANSENEARCYDCDARIVGEPNYNRITGHLYCLNCPPF